MRRLHGTIYPQARESVGHNVRTLACSTEASAASNPTLSAVIPRGATLKFRGRSTDYARVKVEWNRGEWILSTAKWETCTIIQN